MSGRDRRMSPATVAATPGKEREKLLQRYERLNHKHRKELLEKAFYMIGWQEDEKRPKEEREIQRVIDRIENCLDLLAQSPDVDEIQTRIWRAMIVDDKARLAELGVNYFETAGADRARQRPDRSRVKLAPSRILSPRERRLDASAKWRAAIRRVYAADYAYQAAGLEESIARDEEISTWTKAVALAKRKSTFRHYVEMVDRQMAMQAVSRDALQWKQKHRKLDGGRPEWDAAIAHDEEQIAIRS